MSRKSKTIAALREFADKLEASELPDDVEVNANVSFHSLSDETQVLGFAKSWRFFESDDITWIETREIDPALNVVAFGVTKDVLASAAVN